MTKEERALDVEEIKNYARRLGRWSGICFCDHGIRPNREYLYVARHPNNNFSLQLMPQKGVVATQLINPCSVKRFKDSVLSLIKLAQVLHKPIRDQYGDPVPADLMILGRYPVMGKWLETLPKIVQKFDWWTDQTYHLIWVSLGQVPPEFWDSPLLCDPEDRINENPYGPKLRFDFIVANNRKVDVQDNQFVFYHS